MQQDFTQCLKDIDRIQEKLDHVFKRVNADPIYFTEQQIRDAISDNVRYFPVDRKAELCEIFFASDITSVNFRELEMKISV